MFMALFWVGWLLLLLAVGWSLGLWMPFRCRYQLNLARIILSLDNWSTKSKVNDEQSHQRAKISVVPGIIWIIDRLRSQDIQISPNPSPSRYCTVALLQNKYRRSDHSIANIRPSPSEHFKAVLISIPTLSSRGKHFSSLCKYLRGKWYLVSLPFKLLLPHPRC